MLWINLHRPISTELVDPLAHRSRFCVRVSSEAVRFAESGICGISHGRKEKSMKVQQFTLDFQEEEAKSYGERRGG